MCVLRPDALKDAVTHVFPCLFRSLITELEPRAQVSSLITSQRERVLREPTGNVYFY